MITSPAYSKIENKLFLEGNNGILVHIREIHALSLIHDVRMLFNQQPSHVGEKHPPSRIMGVRVRFTILVMNSVIA